MTSQDRREMFATLTRTILRNLKPSMRYSGQQVAYAKGRAWQQMRRMGL